MDQIADLCCNIINQEELPDIKDYSIYCFSSAPALCMNKYVMVSIDYDIYIKLYDFLVFE